MSAMLFLSSTENLNFTEICQKKPLFEQLKNQVLVNSIFLTPYWKKIHPYLAPVNIWRPLTLNYYSEVLDQNHFSWARQQTPCVQCSDYPSMHTAEVINPIKYHKFCQELLPIRMNTTIWVTLCSRMPRNLCLSPGAADSDSKVRDLT